MSTAPADYHDEQIATWLLTYAYFHRRGYFISETELLESIPDELLQRLPSNQHLLRIGWNLCNSQLLDNHSRMHLELTISNDGIFEFRKFLAPLINQAREKGDLNKFIDSAEGNDTVKKKIKDFFKKHSKLSEDEFHQLLKDLMLTLGKEGITILVRLILISMVGQG